MQLPLTPAVFHILLALSGGELHGYAIMHEVSAQSGGSIAMGPGTLYGSLKRMLAAGLVVEAEARPDPTLDDERRRYYKLTEEGMRALKDEADRLASLMNQAAMKRVLGESVSQNFLGGIA
jgi:DNA-binding PadR family transcriptional regulator